MAETKVNLPYFGETDIYVIAAVGGGTVIVIGVLWWRYAQQQKAKQAQKQPQPPEAVFVAGQLGKDPAGNVGPIDPETGYVYGSQEDLERLGQLAIEQYGAVEVYTPSQLTPDVRKEHGKDHDRGDRKADREAEKDKDQEAEKDKDQEAEKDKDQRKPDTNDQWSDIAVHNFQDTYEPSQLQMTIQSIFQGRTVTADQRDNFLRVMARMGPPPQNFPSPIRTSDTAAHPDAGGPLPPFPNAQQQFYTPGML